MSRFKHIDDDPRLQRYLVQYATTQPCAIAPTWIDYLGGIDAAFEQACKSVEEEDTFIRLNTLALELISMIGKKDVVELVPPDSPGGDLFLQVWIDKEGVDTRYRRFLGIYREWNESDGENIGCRLVADLMVEITDPNADRYGTDFLANCVTASHDIMLTRDATMEDIRKIADIFYSYWLTAMEDWDAECVREAEANA